MSGPSRLLLLRHAQSTWNAEGRWQGRADPPLSAAADDQIEEAARRLEGESFGLAVTSELIRARQTAGRLLHALGLTVECHIEPGLREFDAGEWSGLTRDEIERRWPGSIERYARGELAAPPGGEARETFEQRVAGAARRTGAAAATVGADRLLVVTHGGVIRALARAAAALEYRVGQLSGYWGYHDEGGLFPETPVNLLAGPSGRGDIDETAVTVL
jgi:probable phosphoglycerate mutase